MLALVLRKLDWNLALEHGLLSHARPAPVVSLSSAKKLAATTSSAVAAQDSVMAVVPPATFMHHGCGRHGVLLQVTRLRNACAEAALLQILGGGCKQQACWT